MLNFLYKFKTETIRPKGKSIITLKKKQEKKISTEIIEIKENEEKENIKFAIYIQENPFEIDYNRTVNSKRAFILEEKKKNIGFGMLAKIKILAKKVKKRRKKEKIDYNNEIIDDFEKKQSLEYN